jgi:hypothetical protein
MACCIVGSLLMLGIAGAARWLRRHLLRRPDAAPEAWRLEMKG